VQQTFDAKGRLASIAAGATTYVNNFNYTVAGQVSAFSYGNGVTASFGFNAARLQLESLSYANGQAILGTNWEQRGAKTAQHPPTPCKKDEDESTRYGISVRLTR